MSANEKGRDCANSATLEQERHTHSITQEAAILAALLLGDRLTPADALARFACFRLAAIIHKLKRKGYPIQSTLTHVRARDGHRARVSQYWMSGDGEQG